MDDNRNDSDDAELPAIAIMLKQQRLLRDAVEPEALRTMREMQERLRKLTSLGIGSSLKTPWSHRGFFGPSAAATAALGTPALKRALGADLIGWSEQKRIRELVDPPDLRLWRESLEGMRANRLAGNAARIASQRTPIGLAATRSILGAHFIGSALLTARCDQLARRVSRAELGIADLARSLERPTRTLATALPGDFLASHRAQAIEVAGLAGDFGVGTLEEATPDIAASVATETFRVFEVDAAMHGIAGAEGVVEIGMALATEAADELEQLLSMQRRGWLVMLQGARQAVDGSNPDKPRHVLTSLRELLDKVLKAVAPTAEIKKWSTDSNDFSKNGQPTQKARLRFVYSKAKDPALVAFAEADIHATYRLFDLLNKGTHGEELNLSDELLRVVINRVEGTVVFLLRCVSLR